MPETNLDLNAQRNLKELSVETTAGSVSNKPGEEVALLFRHLGVLQIHPPGTVLFAEDAPLSVVSLIEAGVVKFTSTDAEGCEALVVQRSAGTLLGAAAAICRKPAPVTAVTITECRLYQLPTATFLEQMVADQEFALGLNRTISRQYHELMEQYARLATAPARARLAGLLLEWAATATRLPTGELRFQPPYDRKTQAQLLAIREDSLSRLLKEMEEDEVIRRGQGWIYVLDLERLTREAA